MKTKRVKKAFKGHDHHEDEKKEEVVKPVKSEEPKPVKIPVEK